MAAPIDVAAPTEVGAPAERPRFEALDALRGLAIVAMLLVNNPGVRGAMPPGMEHASWWGLTAADVVFPVFLFAMGAAMALSPSAGDARRALRRAGVLFGVGVLLVSVKNGRVGLESGVLQHIAGSFLVAWAVLRLPRALHHALAAAGLLVAAWAVFTFVGGPGIDPGSWAPDRTPAAVVDRWAFGEPSTEGIAVMVVSAANVVGGALVAGSLRRRGERAAADVIARLVAWTVASTAVAIPVVLAVPVAKKLWTPSFALVGHALSCALLLAAVVAVQASRRWARPLVVVGRNPIAVYVLTTLAGATVLRAVRPAFVDAVAAAVGVGPAAIGWAVVVTAGAWLLARELHRRGVIVRV